MCGISGVFFPQRGSTIDVDIDAMMNAMIHRGPDGSGRYSSQDRRYVAGFRRLAIIDPTGADQPLLDPSGRHVLIGNGEIYNYLELRRTDSARSYHFRSEGDMEVVLPLAHSIGDDFVQQLNGIFALALYDIKNHELLLVRDRLGVKPLYWANLPSNGLAFASEIKALFASGLVTPEIDEAEVSSYLAHGYVPGPRTMFRNVHKLMPGHWLKIDAHGSIKITPYWDPQSGPTLSNDPIEIEEHLIELLTDSVRLQLRSDVPVGILLSGGLDSGLLVALAAAHAETALNTYTVRFESGDDDETPLAETVALQYGTNHTTLDLPADSIIEQLPRLAWMIEEPVNDPAALPNYLIEMALSRSVKVALNGTGGDELFAGYGRYFQLPIERRYLNIPHWLRSNLVEPGAHLISPMKAWQLERAGKYVSDRGAYLHEHSTHFPPPVRRMLANNLTTVEPAQRSQFSKFNGPAASGALYADIRTYLPENLLTLVDKTSMAVSVEARVPFLDHRFVEAALAVPPGIRAPGNAQKALERRIASRFLPEEVVAAPKRGFVSPVPSWLRSGLDVIARGLLTRPKTLERGWWSAAGIEKLLAQPERHGYRIYSLLMLEMTVRVHIENGTIEAPTADLEAFL